MLMYRKRRSFASPCIAFCIVCSALSCSASTAEAQTLPLTEQIILDIPHVLQNDPRWADVLIGPNHDVTMGACGCHLSVLSMILKRIVILPWFIVPKEGLADLDFNPVYLDRYLSSGPRERESNYGYINKYGPKSCLGIKLETLLGVGKDIFDHPAGLRVKRWGGGLSAANRDRINANLRANRPTIVIQRVGPGVDPKRPAGYAHAQLIVGWSGTERNDELDEKYLILDPANPGPPVVRLPLLYFEDVNDFEDLAKTVELGYRRWENHIEAIDTFTPTSGASIWFTFGDDPSPIEILMINPEGRRTGFDATTGILFEEDSSASYFSQGGWLDPLGEIDPRDTAKFVTVYDPAEGTYRFQVNGTGDGTLALFAAFGSAGSRGTEIFSKQGTIGVGEVHKFELQYQGAATASVTEVSTFQPQAEAGGDVKGVTGTPVQLDGTRSVDYDGNIASYLWDLGDGATATGARASHTYGEPGTYLVKLTVADDAGMSATDTMQAVIILAQQKPVANPTGPYIGFAATENFPATIRFDGSKSFDPNGDRLTYRWDFGDGSPVQTSSFPYWTHAYAAAGKYTATLVVNDGIEDSEPATTSVEALPALASRDTLVHISRPCGVPGNEVSVEVGPLTLMSLGGMFGNNADWNLGLQGPLPPVPERISLGFSWATPGHLQVKYRGPTDGYQIVPWSPSFSSTAVYSLRLNWMIPDDWLEGTYQIIPGEDLSADFTVPCAAPENYLPVADAGGPYTGVAGQPVRLDATGSSDPDADPLTYFWHFGDGTTGTGASSDHTYAAPGTYIVTLIVNDGTNSSFPQIGTSSFAKVTIAERVQLLCDIDRNGSIDRNDINLIFAARGTTAAPGDPRDVNRDGLITVNDARVCALRCTKPNCVP